MNILRAPHLALGEISGPPFCLFTVCDQVMFLESFLFLREHADEARSRRRLR